MGRERFVVIIDQLDQSLPELRAHFRIDHDLEGTRSGIRFGRSFAVRRGNELEILCIHDGQSLGEV